MKTNNIYWMIDYYETKQHPITRKMVLDAYKKIRENQGGAGSDDQSLSDFEVNLDANLYKIWNRMTSGSYFPDRIKAVEIPKKSGGVRILGIPTVSDRIAQQVVKAYLEPKVEGSFHIDSYGYRPNKSAHNAIDKASYRCGYYAWVVDIDIKGFFDNIDHDLLLKAINWYTQEKWILIYIERWLKVGIHNHDNWIPKSKGTPQGGVISPLLANIFLHFAFDKWMEKYHSYLPFERYCDDIIIHCKTEMQAKFIKNAVKSRLAECKLEMNQEKTRLVYCKKHIHMEDHPQVSFDFLGFTFRPLGRPTKEGWRLTYFPCMSLASKNAVRSILRRLTGKTFKGKIQDLAKIINPKIRGWCNYYCRYSKWTTYGLWYWLNLRLVRWVKEQRKMRKGRAHRWLTKVYENNPLLLEHWKLVRPY